MASGSLEAMKTLAATLRGRMKEAQELQDKVSAGADWAAGSDLEAKVVGLASAWKLAVSIAVARGRGQPDNPVELSALMSKLVDLGLVPGHSESAAERTARFYSERGADVMRFGDQVFVFGDEDHHPGIVEHVLESGGHIIEDRQECMSAAEQSNSVE